LILSKKRGIIEQRWRRSRDGGRNRDFEKSNGTPHLKAKADVLCSPYTAESVVTKRGSIKIEYPSNTQAKKLFALLEEHAQVAHPPILKC
jgi:hypothetical protein